MMSDRKWEGSGNGRGGERKKTSGREWMDGWLLCSVLAFVLYSNTLPLPGVFWDQRGRVQLLLYGIDDHHWVCLAVGM
jgi:hypothetical protein